MGEVDGRTGCRRRVTLAASIGLCCMYPLSFTTAGLFFIHLAPYYRVGNKTITWIAACQSGVGGSFGILAGFMLKRFGALRVGILATVFSVTGLLLGASVDNIYLLYASFGAMFGFGSSTFCLIGFTAAFRAFPDHCPLISGVLATFISVGGLIWAPLIEVLIEHLTWKGALMVMAGICLHGLVLSLLLRDPPTSVNVKVPEEKSDVSHGNGVHTEQSEKLILEKQLRLKESDTIAISKPPHGEVDAEGSHCDKSGSSGCWQLGALTFLTAATLMIACHMNFYTYMPKLNQQNGFSKQQGAFLISTINIASALVRLPAGIIANMKKTSCTLLYGLAMVCGSTLSMLSLLCDSYTDMIILCIFYGIAGGVYMSLQCAALVENVPEKYMEVAMGSEITLGAVSIFILHGTAGFILDAIGDTNVLFFIFGSAGLLGGFLVLTLFTTKYVCGRLNKNQQLDIQNTSQ